MRKWPLIKKKLSSFKDFKVLKNSPRFERKDIIELNPALNDGNSKFR